MKKLLKKEVCGSHKQCTRPTGVTPQPQNAQKKKKKETRRCRRVPFHPYPNPALIHVRH